MTGKRRFVAEGTSYDVRIWELRPTKGKRGTTYTVRWTVAGREFPETFKTRALAHSFRAKLLGAIRRGEAFDLATGRPESMAIETAEEWAWFRLACAYADMKWATSAPKSRVGVAESLAGATVVLGEGETDTPPVNEIRAAMYQWALNPPNRKQPPPAALAPAVQWLSDNTPPVSRLADPVVLRRVLDALGRRLDGSIAAASTYRRKRAVLNSVLEYAVELDLLTTNPLNKLKRAIPKTAEAVDPRVLIDRTRAEKLLEAVGAQAPTGQRLVAFFACMYYAALRPSEAVALT